MLNSIFCYYRGYYCFPLCLLLDPGKLWIHQIHFGITMYKYFLQAATGLSPGCH